ncbi:dickkopf-related protein 3 [Rhinophrynus dorsalis]
MSRLTLLILPLILSLADPSPTSKSPNSEDILVVADDVILEPLFSFTEEKDSLNDMFKEVEELMEDSQSKLANAVKEMEAEELSTQRVPGLSLEKLPPNYHNESITETKIGNKTIQTQKEIIKETDNNTGSVVYSETVIQSVKDDSKKNQECIVDEDCGNGNYCHFTNSESQCLRCKAEEVCTRDGECCEGKLCVWGQCSKSKRGLNGTICDSQSDCQSGFCCAVQPSLLFPVCTPLSLKGELCRDPSRQLLDLIGWEMEPEGVLDRCPCSNGLTCQLQRHTLVSVCGEPSENEDERGNSEIITDDLPFADFWPQDKQEELVYEDSVIIPKAYGLEPSNPEDSHEREREIIPDFPFDDDDI